MSSNFFLFDDDPGSERLRWREEILRFYYTRLRPDNLLDPAKAQDAIITFFLTEDSLYSIQDLGTMQIWRP